MECLIAGSIAIYSVANTILTARPFSSLNVDWIWFFQILKNFSSSHIILIFIIIIVYTFYQGAKINHAVLFYWYDIHLNPINVDNKFMNLIKTIMEVNDGYLDELAKRKSQNNGKRGEKFFGGYFSEES